MGLGFLLLIISLVPLSRAKDLRPAGSAVDRRSAPDALLGEIFNDPSATSLTKLNFEDSDSDNDDFSGSGSELWSGSGELPKPSEDSSSQSETVVTDNSQQKQQTESSTQTETTATGSTNKSSVKDSDDAKDNTDATSSESTANSIDTTPDSTNSDNTPEVPSDSTNSATDSTAAQNVPQQSSTNSSSTTSSQVASQTADAKLPSTEDESQNSVVQTEESNKSSNDKSAINADFLSTQTQNSLETVADNPEAALVSQLATQQATGFDDTSLYDPTIVKKTNVPVAADVLSNPLGNYTMDIPGTVRSAIPQAPVLSPQVPAVRKATVAQLPFKGSFPLQLHKYSPYSKLLKKGLVPKPGAGANQQASKKSVVPGLTDAGGLRPLADNLPQQQQQQQDATNAQGFPQPQVPALDANPAVNPAQMSFGDQVQAAPQAPAAPQPFAPANLTEPQAFAQAPAQFPAQNPQQALDQVQGGVPQAPEQAFVPQAAAPSDIQAPGPENVAAAFPMNTTMNDAMLPSMSQETVGIPAQGAQVVPVYQGLKPKKQVIEEDECDDQFDTCPEMKKNDYCTKYVDLMKIQCKKSCGFCEIKKHVEESGSGYDAYDESGSASLYYADEVSGSGSGSSDWKEDDEEEDEPDYRKSGIPKPLHKVLMAKFSAGSGSGSGSPELDESSTSNDDISETSGSGEAGSGSQKKDEVQASMAASGSGESSVPVAASPTAGTAEIGSGSGSLAEDLATGTVSRINEKHSSIPRPPAPAPQVSVYPKIDLKEIAKAVNMYRGVALKMLGEALEGAAEQKEEELSKKSHIPLPPATSILQRMGFPVGYEDGTKRNMIPNAMPVLNPMDPNYGMLGYGNNGYAYNYPQNPATNEPLADFYSQYQQETNMARSGIMEPPQEEPQQQSDDEGAAQDEQPEEIQPATPPSTETDNATTTEDKPDVSQNKTTNDNNKKSEIVDPFEYVRNMGTGASMEPIRSKTASNFKSVGHSDALILWKNSQSTSLNVLAKKKSTIPEPEIQPVNPAFTDSQPQFAAEQQQFRSDVPQQNITTDAPYMSQQKLPESAPVFQQYTPQSEALTQDPGDGLAARSQITQNFVDQQQPQQMHQGEQESSLRELRSYFPEDE